MVLKAPQKVRLGILEGPLRLDGLGGKPQGAKRRFGACPPILRLMDISGCPWLGHRETDDETAAAFSYFTYIVSGAQLVPLIIVCLIWVWLKI